MFLANNRRIFFGCLHFNFLPTFFKFFKTFNYLPPSISFKYVQTSDISTLTYLFALFIRQGQNLNLYRVFLKFSTNLWCLLNIFQSSDLKINNIQTTSVVFIDYYKRLKRFFTKFKFIYFFYFQTLNKNVYKHSNYKRPRYSFQLRYLPPFKRVKGLLKFMQKSFIYLPERTFNERFVTLFFTLFLSSKQLYFYKFTLNLQKFILLKKKRLLLN